LQAIDKAAKAEVEEAVQQAKESPEPDLKDFWTDIYVRSFRPRFIPFGNNTDVPLCLHHHSTRAPSHLSCVGGRRRRSTTTLHKQMDGVTKAFGEIP
jgi:hypothetical protein